MPLPTSGPISLSMIRAEFGGAAPDSLSEYYAGGAYVPAGTSGTNGPIPSSGPISFSNFYGAPALAVALADSYAASASMFQASAAAQFQLGSDGSIRMTTSNNNLVFIANWLTAGSASEIEVRATVIGSAPSHTAPVGGSATGTWLNLGSTRSWTVTRNSPGVHSQLLSVELRRASNGAVLDSATVQLEAEYVV